MHSRLARLVLLPVALLAAAASPPEATAPCANARLPQSILNGPPAGAPKDALPTVDVRETRRHLGLSQAAFAAKFGFQPATLRNWEQGRTRPDGPARVLLAVIARHPEAVEDALRKAS